MIRRTFNPRTLFAYYLAAVLPLVGMTWFHLASFERTLTEAVLQHHSSIADKKADQIDTYLSERRDLALLFSKRRTVREALAGLSQAFRQGGLAAAVKLDQTYRTDFDPMLELGQFYDLLLIDADGNVVYSLLQEQDLGTNLRWGPFRDTGLAAGYHRAMGTLHTDITAFAPYAPSGQKQAAFLVAPIVEDGRPVGTLALQVNWASLELVLSDRTGLGRSSEVVLGRSEGDWILFTSALMRVPEAAFNFRIHSQEAPFPMLEAVRGSHACGLSRDYAGTAVAAAWRHLPALGWGMVVKTDADEALAPFHRIRRLVWLAMALFLAASGTAMLLLNRRFHAADVQLQESQELFSKAFHSNPIAMGIRRVTDDVLLDLNPAFEKLFGYPREEILGKKVGDIDFFSRPEDQQAVEENLRKLKPIYGLELELRDTAGIPLDLLLTVDYLSLGKEPCAIASFLDITERKRVESAIRESEIRLNEAQHIAQVGSWAIDLQDGTGSWSEQTFHILELDEFSTAPGVDAFLSRVHPEDHERVREITGRLAQTPGVREFTCRLLLPDGRIKHIANRVVTECDSAGNPRNIAGTLQDVTERVLFEELIHAQLVEKEVLLREIHHRVKNNLNIVSSMLYLQGAAAGEDRITALFEESRARVQAMALVHELLYQSGDMGRIDLKSYLEQLGQGLLASYSDGSAAVSIATDVSVPPVSIQVAIPCGLIVCELVTNALKYAFRGRAGGRIRVALAEREGRFVLGVADDGVGLAAARQARPGSIGLNLVQALADQLDGTLESRSDGGGTVFTVTFKVQESGR